jgi:1,4-alpha-glucan branching enzyme
MSAAQTELIVQGRHRDPFSYLGPHKGQIRAWLPQAKDAVVLAGEQAIQMKRAHPAGLYVAKTDAVEYRIRITLYSGETEEVEDPYRFPPLLTAFELHLHGEGTNYESYRTLGAHMVTCEGVEGVRFAVWAPNAEVVSVTGDHNTWDRTRHPMRMNRPIARVGFASRSNPL